MLVKGATIPKGCLDPYIKSLLLSLYIHVLENTGGVREHGKCESARKIVVYVLFCGFSL